VKEILITSSVLIAAILLLRQLFQKTISRRVQYALWLLVLVRLLIPFNLPALEHNVLTVVEPVNESIESQLENQMIYAIPTETYPSSLNPGEAPVIDRTYHSDYNADGEETTGYYSGGVVIDEESTTHYFFMMPVKEAISVIWYMGMVVTAFWMLVSNLSFYRKLRKARTHYSNCNSKHKVYLVEAGLPSPCIFGPLRPAIYLTPAAVSSPTRLRHVLAHEETHIRHLDFLWSLLRSICLVIYWFDPLVWAAAVVSRTDCELACDEGAMERLGAEERLAYGETLLSLIPLRRGAANPLLSATTMTSDKKRLRDRITRIAENRQTVAAALFLAISLILVVCAATFTGAKTADTPDDDTQQPSHSDTQPSGNGNETAPTTLEDALRQAVEARFQSEIPADYAHTAYTTLAYRSTDKEVTAYILALYRGFSGSPAISETGQTVIHCQAFLPAAVTFRLEDGRYTLAEYWEPSRKNYEADIRAKFQTENTIDEVLLHMSDYAVTLFPEDAQPFYAEDFASAPVWPAYRFTEDVTDEGICWLAAYYDPRDIYAQPVRTELLNRFLAQPVALVNALAAGCKPEQQDFVWNILTESTPEDGIDPAARVLLSSAVLTPEGGALVQRFLPSDTPDVQAAKKEALLESALHQAILDYFQSDYEIKADYIIETHKILHSEETQNTTTVYGLLCYQAYNAAGVQIAEYPHSMEAVLEWQGDQYAVVSFNDWVELQSKGISDEIIIQTENSLIAQCNAIAKEHFSPLHQSKPAPTNTPFTAQPISWDTPLHGMFERTYETQLHMLGNIDSTNPPFIKQKVLEFDDCAILLGESMKPAQYDTGWVSEATAYILFRDGALGKLPLPLNTDGAYVLPTTVTDAENGTLVYTIQAFDGICKYRVDLAGKTVSMSISSEPEIPETPDVPDTPVTKDPVAPGTEIWPAEPQYYTATGSESSSRTYVQNYLVGWELQEEIDAGSRSFLIYRKGNSNFIFAVTRSGKYCQMPLPFADSAHQYAAVSRYHLDTTANTFTYEAVIPNRVVSVNTGVLMSEAGTWRYVVNMNTDTLTRSFTPAPAQSADPNDAYEYHDAPLALSDSPLTYEQLIEWVQKTEPDPVYGALVSTGEYWEDGNGNVVYVGRFWGVPRTSYGMHIQFSDGTEASLELPMDGGMVTLLPDNQYFKDNTFVYEIALSRMTRYQNQPTSGICRFTVDLTAKTHSLDIVY